MTDTTKAGIDKPVDAKDQATAAADTGDIKTTSSDKPEATVPSFRLREETDRRKAIEKENAEANRQLDEYRKKDKDNEEKDAIAAGKFEETLGGYKTDLETKEAQLNAYKEKESFVKGMADEKFEAIKAAHGEEVLNQVKNIIDSEDPYVILKKVSNVLALLGQGSGSTVGDDKNPGLAKSSQTRKQDLMNRLKQGQTLNGAEQKELRRLTVAKR